MQTFCLAFDDGRFSSQPQVVDAFLSNHKNISGWSSPFSGFYFLTSEININELRESLDDFFSSKGFIIASIETNNTKTDGRAPEEIWDWLKSSSKNES